MFFVTFRGIFISFFRKGYETFEHTFAGIDHVTQYFVASFAALEKQDRRTLDGTYFLSNIRAKAGSDGKTLFLNSLKPKDEQNANTQRSFIAIPTEIASEIIGKVEAQYIFGSRDIVDLFETSTVNVQLQQRQKHVEISLIAKRK